MRGERNLALVVITGYSAFAEYDGSRGGYRFPPDHALPDYGGHASCHRYSTICITRRVRGLTSTVRSLTTV